MLALGRQKATVSTCTSKETVWAERLFAIYVSSRCYMTRKDMQKPVYKESHSDSLGGDAPNMTPVRWARLQNSQYSNATFIAYTLTNSVVL